MKKSTFYFAVYSNGNFIPHLYFVLSDPNKDNEVLVVNMSSVHDINRVDQSCILEVGEHEKITNRSFMFYGKAKAMKVKEILEGCMMGIIENQKEVSDVLLQRMQIGAKKSPFLPEGLKKFFNNF